MLVFASCRASATLLSIQSDSLSALDSEDALSDNANNSSSSIALHDSGIASMTPQETTPSRTSSSQTLPVRDLQPTVVRAKRQDWCRWPICKEYYRGNACSNEENGKRDGKLCQLAHVREEEGVSVTGDNYVRVCFDSMGLVQVCAFLLPICPSQGSQPRSLVGIVSFRDPIEEGIIAGLFWLSFESWRFVGIPSFLACHDFDR